MAALVIGLAIGFAGGYGIGTTRDHTTSVLTEAQVSPASAAPAPGRDATEMAVTPKPEASVPATAAPRAPQPRPTAKPDQGSTTSADRRSTPPPDRRAAAHQEPERQTTRPRPTTTPPVPAGTSGEFVGRLNVDSRPVGARVFLDNKQIGVTPLAMPGIRAGEHAIRLERDGYRHWTSTVRVVAGEQNRVTASLDR
ncbi:MAG TPA: PEGA domain-containing protein [Vicinamibacterales bacterium]|jgi:hypothetical protein